MKKELFFTLVVVCILAHIVRLTYEIMKHRKTIRPGRVSFIIVFTDMIILWVSWFLICKYDYHEIHFPGIVRSAGLLLSFAGIIAFLTGLFTIKTLESYEGDLITTGIYSIIRHPMYVGFISWLIGFPLYFESLLPLILSIFLILNVLFWRFLEEKELEQRFPSYRDYRKKTIF
jgi:protein-S-isoprenylcysteine O-methyltransferase Ste14